MDGGASEKENGEKVSANIHIMDIETITKLSYEVDSAELKELINLLERLKEICNDGININISVTVSSS